MEIPNSMLSHIKEVARGIDYGEILIKLNKARNIIDVTFSNTERSTLGETEIKPGEIREDK